MLVVTVQGKDSLLTRWKYCILVVIDSALAAFALEARRADGNLYPGNTLKNMLSALFHENQGAVNVKSFVDKGSRERNYPLLTNMLDRQLHGMLRNSGIGVECKRAHVQQQLWDKGLHSPQAPLNIIFFSSTVKISAREEFRNILIWVSHKFSMPAAQSGKFTQSLGQRITLG